MIIIKTVFFIKCIYRVDNDRRRHTDTGKEADAKRDDRENGKKPAERAPDLPEGHEVECLFMSHGLSSDE